MKAFHVIIGAGVVGAAIGSAAAFMSVAGPAPLSLDDLAPAGPPAWLGSNFIYGPTSLPVSFSPGPRRGAS